MTEQKQTFEIHKIYIKDLSFESPHAPEVFRKQWQPKTDIQLAAEHTQIDEGLYEVTLNVTITAKQEEKTVFLIEVKQSGLFKVAGFEGAQLGQLLGSYCPGTLFPFAREAISDLVGKGGFPQLLLSPVNFDLLYSQHLQKMKHQAQTGSDITH